MLVVGHFRLVEFVFDTEYGHSMISVKAASLPFAPANAGLLLPTLALCGSA